MGLFYRSGPGRGVYRRDVLVKDFPDLLSSASSCNSCRAEGVGAGLQVGIGCWLNFARVAITGLKLNVELPRIDGEVLDLKRQLMENKLVDSRRDDLSKVPQRKSNEVSPSTLEDLKKSQEAIQISSRLQFLLERKKFIIHNGDSKEMHAQKVDKLTLLAESLAISTTKAEKQIANNRHQKEEELNYCVAISHEVEQIKKELATEIQGLEKKSLNGMFVLSVLAQHLRYLLTNISSGTTLLISWFLFVRWK